MLVRERKQYWVEYKCEKCNKILGELVDSGETIIRGNCEHYRWHEVSAECYYYTPPGCGKSYIKWLKQNYELKLDDPGTVYLLIPRQS